jgi:hypothetical protein
MCHVLVKNMGLQHYILLVYHLSPFKVSVRSLVMNNSIHDEVDMRWLTSLLRDDISLFEVVGI